jgi:hypothetical protein
MAPQQPLTIIDPPSWERSTAMTLAQGQLVAGGQMAANVDGQPPEWIVSSERKRVPNPSYGYIVSFMRFHECGFTTPVSRFLRGLYYHYRVDRAIGEGTRSRRRPRSSASARASWGSL